MPESGHDRPSQERIDTLPLGQGRIPSSGDPVQPILPPIVKKTGLTVKWDSP